MSSENINVEVLIVGAGLIGSSLAMHLGNQGVETVRLVDFDFEGSLSSSELNAGGVRATFNQPLNILASKHSIEYFAQHAAEVGYRACGYLWLQTSEKMAAALKARDRQTELGWPVDAWDVTALRDRVPFIDRTDDLAGALFAPRDGLINPNLLKNHFRSTARTKGVVCEDRVLVRSAELQVDGSWIVTCEKFPSVLTGEQKIAVLSSENPSAASAGVPATQLKYRAQKVVNCAGAWAGQLAKILGYESPCYPLRRQISMFDCRELDLTPYGMIVDTSGVYFHPEATSILGGLCNVSEPRGINFQYDADAYFEEYIWPNLAERASVFEKLRHLTGWAGLYEVSPDDSAIIGAVEQGAPGAFFKASGKARVFEAHSFSGHGAMHSYAAGLALAELMTSGRYSTLDFAPFSATRFDRNELIHETAVI
ncbi:MAG: FAD-binding oxidoreductase [Methylotenera sp.]|nr:FAD-binding oxidoreductase [Oligoflexia bacterium]